MAEAHKGEQITFRDGLSVYTMTKEEAVQHYFKKESTFFQWKYLLQIIVTFSGFFLISLFKGPGNEEPSIVGVKKCNIGWWSLFFGLILFGILMSVLSILIVKHEYEVKKQINWVFTPCDYKYEGLGSSLVFPIFALLSTFAAVLAGFSPGFFYMPFLLL